MSVTQAIENLCAVLCDPEGRCCISGSDADRQIIDEALAALRTSAASLRDEDADAARLDWLETQFADGVHVEGCYSGSFSEASLKRCATVFYGNKEARAGSIRDAIDAASQPAAQERQA